MLQLDSKNAHASFLMGYLLHQAGQWEPALQHLTRAASANPAVPEVWFLIGLIHQQHRNFDAAIPAYQQSLKLQPRNPKAMNNLGRALIDSGRLAQGIEQLKKTVDADARNVSAMSNLGDAYRIAGDFNSSVQVLQRAVAVDPNFAEAHSNLGSALAKQGNLDQAIPSMRRAIALNPALPTPHFNLARVFQDQGLLDESIESCRAAIAVRLTYSEAVNLLGNLHGTIGAVTEAVALQRRAVELKPGNAGAHSNLLLSLHYNDDISPAQVFNAHLEWARLHADPLRQSIEPVVPEPTDGRRLRVGYVSPNLMKHSVAYFLEPVLAAHDRTAVEIFCYSDAVRPDSTTAQFKTLCDHWRDVAGRPDVDVAAMIRQDRIDVLVDLAGHTADNRMRLFALKPAPVQMTWIGYPDTTGLSTMDFRITDAISDPFPAAESLHTEKLIRVVGGCWAYLPPTDSPPVAETPAIANGFVTFGSFNNLPKVTSTVLDTWSGILRQVPGSQMIIKASGLASRAGRDRIVNSFTHAEIDPARIELIQWAATTTDHLKLYDRIDVALDTFPYNGTTTTCEALWMGVPVVTFAGTTHAGRVGASLLANAGLSEYVTGDVADYAGKAIELAGDVERLSTTRREIRGKLSSSPLMDGRRLARSIESVFEEAVKRLAK